MKKILPMIIFIIMIIISTQTVNAATADVDITLNGEVAIEEGTKTFSLTINLGKFTGITEGSVMAYETTLEYDTNLFKSIEVKGTNDWSATYAEGTKKILGETNKGKANKEITQIILTLKDNVAVGTKGNVTLKDFSITDDINLDKTVTLSKKDIKITAKPVIDNNTTNTANTVNTTNIISGTNTTNSSSDKTTTNTILPKAGLQNILIISIILIILGGIGFYIRSKTIKIK